MESSKYSHCIVTVHELNRSWLLGLLFMSILFFAPLRAQELSVESLMQEAQKSLAPDRRTRVFDVKGYLQGTELTVKGEVHSADLKESLLGFLRGKTSYKIIDSLVALPSPALGDKTYALVSVSVANLRSKPSHFADMATQVLLGTPLRVLKKDDGWYYVQTPEEYLGWTDDPMALWNQEQFDRWEAAPRAIVTVEYGFARRTKEKNSDPVSDVVIGAILKLKSDAGTHYEVEYPDGRVAFLAKEDAEPFSQWLSEAKNTPERIASTARRFTGVPYLWGGTSAKGFDCSGFTKTVYYLNGIMLPRDADQQSWVGEAVDTSAGLTHLKSGDLLFFGRRATSEKPERVTHVGVYLGGLQFIHCSGDLHINSFNPQDSNYSDYRRSGFLKAKRIIGAPEATGVRRLSQIKYYSGHEHQ